MVCVSRASSKGFQSIYTTVNAPVQKFLLIMIENSFTGFQVPTADIILLPSQVHPFMRNRKSQRNSETVQGQVSQAATFSRGLLR